MGRTAWSSIDAPQSPAPRRRTRIGTRRIRCRCARRPGVRALIWRPSRQSTGEYVYQPSGSILTAIDASDAKAPIATGRTDTTPTRGEINNVVSLGNGYLYAAFTGPTAETDGIAVLSIADPAHPQLIAQIAYEAEAREIGTIVAGNGELFVFDQGAGIFRADLSDPAAPVLAQVLQTFTSYGDGRIEGKLFYGNGYNFFGHYSVGVFDIADPAAPVQLGDGSVAGAHYVSAALVPPMVVGIGCGVALFDYTNPALPIESGTIGSRTSSGTIP